MTFTLIIVITHFTQYILNFYTNVYTMQFISLVFYLEDKR